MAKNRVTHGYNLGAGRDPAQIAKMQELTAKGLCAFCPEYFASYHDSPVEFETKHWIITKNDYPYEHTSLHLLLIARKHVRTLAELSKAARADLLEVVAHIEKQFALPSYALGMRVGDIHYNGGSVDHLHAQLIVGDGSGNSVKFKMSSVPQ